MTATEYLNLKNGDELHSDFDSKNSVFIKKYRFKGYDNEVVKIRKATFGDDTKIHRLSKRWVINFYFLGKKETYKDKNKEISKKEKKKING